jgi:hypothetical protein
MKKEPTISAYICSNKFAEPDYEADQPTPDPPDFKYYPAY